MTRGAGTVQGDKSPNTCLEKGLHGFYVLLQLHEEVTTPCDESALLQAGQPLLKSAHTAAGDMNTNKSSIESYCLA